MPRNEISFLNWVIATALAEALGIAVVSVTYAAVDRGLLVSANVWILAAGGWEGLCLGTAQAGFLSRLRVPPVLWVGVTVAGAMAGYGLSLIGASGGPPDGSADLPLWLMGLLGAVIGLGMGLAMGLIQSLALNDQLPANKWILANALGWMPAMAAIMVAAGLATQDWSLPRIAGVGAAAGAIAGLCVGIATGLVARSGPAGGEALTTGKRRRR